MAVSHEYKLIDIKEDLKLVKEYLKQTGAKPILIQRVDNIYQYLDTFEEEKKMYKDYETPFKRYSK